MTALLIFAPVFIVQSFAVSQPNQITTPFITLQSVSSAPLLIPLSNSPMRRSTQVAAPLLAAAAFSMLTGCRKPEMQRCVDEQNHVVDDSFCANQPSRAATPRRSRRFPPSLHPLPLLLRRLGRLRPRQCSRRWQLRPRPRPQLHHPLRRYHSRRLRQQLLRRRQPQQQ